MIIFELLCIVALEGENMPYEIVSNDITKMYVDAIVNQTDSQAFGTESVLTVAENIHAAYIIHTVGPTWDDNTKVGIENLRNCYLYSLELAKKNGIESIAFPLISSDDISWPKDIALNVAVSAIGEFLLSNDMMVYLVIDNKESYKISEALYASVEAYIDANYEDETLFDQHLSVHEESDYFSYENAKALPNSSKYLKELKSNKKTLDDVVNQLDETFAEMLMRLIDEKGLRDPDVYKKANVTKQTFSKLRNNDQYNPSKQTVLAFAIALELNLDETKDLLLKAGYALSNSSRFDVIVSYFIENESYNLFEINAVLFEYDENTLGI